MAQTQEQFVSLLREATLLYERNFINAEALTKLVIARAQVEIKALLFQTALGSASWHDFLKKAEESCWIAFPEKILSRVERGGTSRPTLYKKHPNSKQKRKFCELHGETSSHDTAECV